jgi:C4-dicarboxylate-specific signal transduction histidine kinase
MNLLDSDQRQDRATFSGAEKLSTGLFTAGVAHEINNPANPRTLQEFLNRILQQLL